ncbi:MAG: glycosyltransferase family 2 protein [Bacteroidales bacterium]
MDNCILTIGLPVFNDVKYIEKSLVALLNQTFCNFKLIISDDCSSDGSQQICEKYAQKDNRIIYIRQIQNLGISRNMQFLLTLANTPYFMWAGDDDLYAPTFIENLIDTLEKSNAISVFCNFATIDEQDSVIETYTQFQYAEPNQKKRLKKFIRNSHDAFGYGIFKTDYIREVQFPIWWWPNKNTPYNNIYPTLCYYLTKGDYAHVNGDALFFKRVKTGKNVHHKIPGQNNAIKESLAYWIRRFNLVIFSSQMILKASNIWLMLYIFPYLFYNWFIIPSINQFNLAFNAFIKKVIQKNKVI